MAAAARNNTPCVAPRPVATLIDIGVAKPKANWQAMISTDTALIRPNTHLGSGPENHQIKNVSSATETTVTTNQPATMSAMFCIGALERYAWATICTICDSMVAAPTCSERMTRAPLLLSAAPIT